MKKKHPFLDWFGGTGLAILAVLVFGMGLVSFGMGHRQELNRLDQQKEDIDELMSIITKGAVLRFAETKKASQACQVLTSIQNKLAQPQMVVK
jgi:uncharacterized protein HemX